MYKISSNCDPLADAILQTVPDKRVERWIAAGAWWLGRQQIYGESGFWFALAAQVTSMLPSVDREDIVLQLNRQEEVLMTAPGWPEITAGLASIAASWAPTPVEIDLVAAKADAVVRVDKEAESYRMNFITPGFGQVMTYQQKLEEARALLNNAEVAPETIPHIVREAAVDGITPSEKAQQIVNTFLQWQQLSAAIEGLRMSAKKGILEAVTAEDIQSAATINWPPIP